IAAGERGVDRHRLGLGFATQRTAEPGEQQALAIVELIEKRPDASTLPYPRFRGRGLDRANNLVANLWQQVHVLVTIEEIRSGAEDGRKRGELGGDFRAQSRTVEASQPGEQNHIGERPEAAAA